MISQTILFRQFIVNHPCRHSHQKNSAHPISTPKHEQGFVLGFFMLVILIGLILFFVFYAHSLNQTIIQKFESRKWDVPARIYSRPLDLSQGNVDKNDLDTWLKLLNYTKSNDKQLSNSGTYFKNKNNYIIRTRGFHYGDVQYNTQNIQINFSHNQISSIRTEIATDKVFLEPVLIGGIYPDSHEDRRLVAIKDVPQPLIDALIATEDRTFYQHHGISLRGTTRAIINNLKGGGMQGGSTLTQQLVKNFYLTSERSFKRKINEALMALLLEFHTDKEQILQAYINEINLGQNGQNSINGFGIAAQFYFDRPLSELRLDQHALLVGIAKGPSFYNPREHQERAKERRNVVLNNMLQIGKITPDEYQKAINQPLDVVKTPTIAKPRFPDFLDFVQRELTKRYRQKDLQGAGLRIITTLDPIAQLAAEKAIQNKLPSQKLQGALVSADPRTGELVALVGSVSDFTGFNRAIDSKRQVGSLLKPMIYLMALDSRQYNLAKVVHDEPLSYNIGRSNQPWTPKNYSRTSHGDVPLITALANSYNQAAVNTGMDFGVENFNKYLIQLGIQDKLPNYPSVLLGAIELSPLQILSMYQTLATGGVSRPLYSIQKVLDEQNKVLSQNSTDKQDIQLLPPDATYLTVHAMQSVIKEGTAQSANKLGNELNLAGKTGTTNDSKDAWFAGFSGNYTTVVWVGRDDNKPTGYTGASGALPIWIDFMRRLKLLPVKLEQPINIEWGFLENLTGLKADETCPNAIYVPYIIESVSGIGHCTADSNLINDEEAIFDNEASEAFMDFLDLPTQDDITNEWSPMEQNDNLQPFSMESY